MVREHRPDGDEQLLRRAYEFAREAHAGASRASGQPYISHPLEVAVLLAELGLDDHALAATLLHDVIEDTSVTADELRKEFGEEITGLVHGVTKLSRIDFRTQRERQAQNLRKMLLAVARDLRVILIKLADRLHNMRTLKSLPQERRRSIAEETLHIYAPIAHRLGVWRLKWELEDLALRHIDPRAYHRIVRQVARTREDRERTVNQAVAQLRERLDQVGIKADIYGRPKHFYSIYQKMQAQGVDFDQILDLQAIRVLVTTLAECYSVLGEVHTLWLPLPGMFTDYIAKPKANFYQALHTKVFGPNGEPMEVQIRTYDMHRTAEYGVAAHWRYKEGEQGDRDLEQKLSWLRQLLDLQHDLQDPGEWLESLKIDLFQDQVFVFTPRGDVIDLPAGSTPVDFAYRIHTDIGHSCVGARVNGRIVPLNYVFHNGDVAEILTSKTSAGPSLDWLSFVKTSQAKGRIKSWYRKVRREDDLHHGREMLQEEIARHGLQLSETERGQHLSGIAARMNFISADDLAAAVGHGDVTAEAIVNRIKAQLEQKRKPPLPVRKARQGALQLGISAPGMENVLFRLSRCCAPIPGDHIVGYITRGRGLTIHRQTCPNVTRYAEREAERLVEVEWTFAKDTVYPAEIEVEALDRVGLLNDVTGIITSHEMNISSARVRTTKPRKAMINLTVDVTGTEHLQNVIGALGRLSDVLNARRVMT
ncbi:MAG: bifunctional (p)ppGpp synthetase/guanosine-3',5'-bis(diphosphate) 3'-pyrophosphohydrolase [Armatimonadota bacterium]|nr:MAG: bifunctional (p)ppGpp synthetase/guanosine-3',5'-bis(diphosphate) 3'-pyrophosphohydrolase [Armatimonadota bacterium]